MGEQKYRDDSGNLKYEMFWKTTSQEIGKFWNDKPNTAAHHVTFAPTPPQECGSPRREVSQALPSFQPPASPKRSPPPPAYEKAEECYEAPAETYEAPAETSRAVIDVTQYQAPEGVSSESPPRRDGLRPTFPDQEILNEVDFLGRADKMSKQGSPIGNFPPKTPAEEYMQNVQGRLWNAITW